MWIRTVAVAVFCGEPWSVANTYSNNISFTGAPLNQQMDQWLSKSAVVFYHTDIGGTHCQIIVIFVVSLSFIGLCTVCWFKTQPNSLMVLFDRFDTQIQNLRRGNKCYSVSAWLFDRNTVCSCCPISAHQLYHLNKTLVSRYAHLFVKINLHDVSRLILSWQCVAALRYFWYVINECVIFTPVDMKTLTVISYNFLTS